jgi:hypothetical protein
LKSRICVVSVVRVCRVVCLVRVCLISDSVAVAGRRRSLRHFAADARARDWQARDGAVFTGAVVSYSCACDCAGTCEGPQSRQRQIPGEFLRQTDRSVLVLYCDVLAPCPRHILAGDFHACFWAPWCRAAGSVALGTIETLLMLPQKIDIRSSQVREIGRERERERERQRW